MLEPIFLSLMCVCVCFSKKKKKSFFFTNNHSPYQQFLKFFVQKFVSLALFKVEEFLLQKKIKISQNNYENLRKLGNFLLLNLVQVGDLSPNEILTFIRKKIV